VWENYTDALDHFPLVRAFLNTVVVVFGVMVGRLVTASLAAYAFARLRFPLRGPLFMVVLGTLMIPFHVTLIPQFLLFRQLKWTDSVKPLIVPAFFGGGAFYIFLLRQFFLTIPLEMDDAARIDGCGVFGTFWHIILPLSLPALGTVAIYTFMEEWNAFLRPLIYLNSPDKQTLAIALRHWQLGGVTGVGTLRVPWTQIMAMASLITVPPLVTFFATQRYFIQGVVVTGLKG
jgi:ABC-type glycerol-3-phosphate transport system permease component